MQGERIKVLYIAGFGRSGSTILDNVVGQVDGFFAAGEVWQLWHGGPIDRRLCGCGALLPECPVWHPILSATFGGTTPTDIDRVAREIFKPRTRHVALTMSEWGRRSLDKRAARFQEVVTALYGKIRDVTGARVIVDCSKLPMYGYLLGRNPSLDVHVVHLVRDAHGPAYSWWRRRKPEPYKHRSIMPAHHPAKTSLFWNSLNGAADLLWGGAKERYLRVRYEDFVSDPRHWLERIVALVGAEPGSLPFTDGRRVRLAANHTAGGNPNRFESGEVTLENDREWQQKMPGPEKLLVTALTWPLLLRYGYLFPRTGR